MKMRLKICFILLILLAIFKNGYAMEVTEDDQNIYTTLNWNEIADDVQRDIMLFFSNKISNKLQARMTGLEDSLNWGQQAKQLLIGTQDQFNTTTSQMTSQATNLCINTEYTTRGSHSNRILY